MIFYSLMSLAGDDGLGGGLGGGVPASMARSRSGGSIGCLLAWERSDRLSGPRVEDFDPIFFTESELFDVRKF
jgi:hypothetical protein